MGMKKMWSFAFNGSHVTLAQHVLRVLFLLAVLCCCWQDWHRTLNPLLPSATVYRQAYTQWFNRDQHCLLSYRTCQRQRP